MLLKSPEITQYFPVILWSLLATMKLSSSYLFSYLPAARTVTSVSQTVDLNHSGDMVNQQFEEQTNLKMLSLQTATPHGHN